jgi:glycogen synthase
MPAMRVGIISFELEGVTRNGGIGTAYRLLADELVKMGAEVTVLLSLPRPEIPADWASRRAQLARQGIQAKLVMQTPKLSRNAWFA